MFIFGDHGMTEFGGHGGFSEFERNVAFVLIDSKLKNSTSRGTMFCRCHLTLKQI